MNLHKAYQSGSIRSILKAIKKVKPNKPQPYCEEDSIDAMVKKNEYLGDLIKKFKLTS